MMENRFIGLAVGLTVGVILLSGFLWPIISDATSTTETFYNEGPRMAPLGDETLTITYENDVWTIGDRSYDISTMPITQGTVMLYGVSHSARSGYLYVADENGYQRINVNRAGTYSFEYNGTTKTVATHAVISGNEYSSIYNYVGEIYYINPTGDYAWFGEKPTQAYIPEDWNNFNAWSQENLHFYAIMGDQIIIDGIETTEGVSTDLITSNVAGYNGIKTIDSYTLNIDGSEPIQCRGYLLPYKITAEKTEHLDATQIALITAIGTLGAIVLIAAAAGSIRRLD